MPKGITLAGWWAVAAAVGEDAPVRLPQEEPLVEEGEIGASAGACTGSSGDECSCAVEVPGEAATTRQPVSPICQCFLKSNLASEEGFLAVARLAHSCCSTQMLFSMVGTMQTGWK